jgi:predicted Rossmann-fold nucleotide-binding protein
MGSDYWDGLVKWMKETMLEEHGYISPEDLDVFTVVDDPKEAAKIMLDFKESEGRVGIELPSGVKKK